MNGATDKRSWPKGAGYEPTRVFNETDGAWRGASRQRARRDERRRRTRPAAWLALVAGATAICIGGSFVVWAQPAQPPAERPLTDVVREAVEATSGVPYGSQNHRELFLRWRDALIAGADGSPGDALAPVALLDAADLSRQAGEEQIERALLIRVLDHAGRTDRHRLNAARRLTEIAHYAGDYELALRAWSEYATAISNLDAQPPPAMCPLVTSGDRDRLARRAFFLADTLTIDLSITTRAGRDDPTAERKAREAIRLYREYLDSPVSASGGRPLRWVHGDLAVLNAMVGDERKAVEAIRAMAGLPPPRNPENSVESTGYALERVADTLYGLYRRPQSGEEEAVKPDWRRFAAFLDATVGIVSETDRHWAGIQSRRAWAYYDVGEYEECAAILEGIVNSSAPSVRDRLSKDPAHHASCLHFLAKACMELRRFDDARAYYARILALDDPRIDGQIVGDAYQRISLIDREGSRLAEHFPTRTWMSRSK